MSLREQKGCGRTIKAGKWVSTIVKAALEAVMHETAENPTPDHTVVNLAVPAAMRKNAELLLSTGEFDVEYPCCKIIHGDCRNHLINFPPRSFDLIITDPPYGMGFKKPFDKHLAKVEWDERFPTEVVHGISDEAGFLGGLARLGSYVFCRWDNLWDHQFRVEDVAPGASVGVTLSKPTSVLVWHKLGGGAMGDTEHEHIRNYEMALFYPGPEHKFGKQRPPSVLRHSSEGNVAHPTQKPPKLIKEILGWYDDFETVFDPFMGSGTTAVAAKELGKHFFGFEANETYYKDAIQRIAEMDS